MPSPWRLILQIFLRAQGPTRSAAQQHRITRKRAAPRVKSSSVGGGSSQSQEVMGAGGNGRRGGWTGANRSASNLHSPSLHLRMAPNARKQGQASKKQQVQQVRQCQRQELQSHLLDGGQAAALAKVFEKRTPPAAEKSVTRLDGHTRRERLLKGLERPLLDPSAKEKEVLDMTALVDPSDACGSSKTFADSLQSMGRRLVTPGHYVLPGLRFSLTMIVV